MEKITMNDRIEKFLSGLEDYAESFNRLVNRRRRILNSILCWLIWKCPFTDCGKPPILMNAKEMGELGESMSADWNDDVYDDYYDYDYNYESCSDWY